VGGIIDWKAKSKAWARALLVGLLTLLLIGSPFPHLPAHAARKDRPPKVEQPKPGSNKAGIKTGGSIAETSPPEVIQELQKFFESYQPQVTILNPKPDVVLEDNTIAVQFQVKDLPIFKDEKLGLGPHLHVFLDNQPYQAVYDLSKPLLLENLEPGTHTIRAFASRPWHESFKNEGAFAQITFHVYTRTGENNPNPNLPLLTYSRPQSSYGAEPIMLDFYLTNAPLHLVAQEDATDDIADWRIRCTVNGKSFVLDRWQPLYLKGFKPGKNWVQLEFLDEQGNPVKNVFNNTVRVINYEPNGKDTLSRLVRGELTAQAARGIVDPNYAPEPTPVPSESPIPAPTSTPSIKPTLSPPPTPTPPSPTSTPTPEAKVSPEPQKPIKEPAKPKAIAPSPSPMEPEKEPATDKPKAETQETEKSDQESPERQEEPAPQPTELPPAQPKPPSKPKLPGFLERFRPASPTDKPHLVRPRPSIAPIPSPTPTPDSTAPTQTVPPAPSIRPVPAAPTPSPSPTPTEDNRAPAKAVPPTRSIRTFPPVIPTPTPPLKPAPSSPPTSNPQQSPPPIPAPPTSPFPTSPYSRLRSSPPPTPTPTVPAEKTVEPELTPTPNRSIPDLSKPDAVNFRDRFRAGEYFNRYRRSTPTPQTTPTPVPSGPPPVSSEATNAIGSGVK
jgi:hypothetical protein